MPIASRRPFRLDAALLAACLLLSTIPPAAAQQERNPPRNEPRPGQGQAPPRGGNAGVPSHLPPHIQEQIRQQQIREQQEMEWWWHQMQMQQELARQQQAAREARRKQAAGKTDLGGNEPSPKTPSPGMTSMGGKVPPKTPPPGTGNMGAHGNDPSLNTPGMGGPKRPAMTPGSGTPEPPSGGKPQESEHHAGETKLAAVIPGKPNPARPERLRQPLIHDQGIVGTLRTVHGKLRKTDNDYEGHRLHAMEAVTLAIHHLGSQDSLGLAGSGNVPPAESVTNLRESLIKLRHVEASLSLETAPAHHAAARHAVAEAIRHVHAALEERGHSGMAMR